MNILHVSDLHLGKTIYEHSLIEDQKYILTQIIEELQQFDYQVLIIAGDIYDRSIPPPEAVKLFDDFLTEIHQKFSKLNVCIIAGNHDSGTRLAFVSSLLHSQNIHIVGTPENAFKPLILGEGDSKVQFFLLPSLTPGSLKQEVTKNTLQENRTENQLYSQEDLLKEAINRIKKEANKNLPAVLIGHLFTTNGIASDSERHFIGTVEQVPSSLFADFSYTALGHLHKPQKISETIWYSGSPLSYSFDEASYKKNMLRVILETKKTKSKELTNDLFSEQVSQNNIDNEKDNLDKEKDNLFVLPKAKVTVSQIEFTPLHKMDSLKGNFSEFYQGTDFDKYKDYYLEITLNNSEIVISPMQLLKNKFPNLLSIRQDLLASQNENDKTNNLPNRNKNNRTHEQEISENFELFLKDLYGEELTKVQTDEKELFTKLSGEILNETDQT